MRLIFKTEEEAKAYLDQGTVEAAEESRGFTVSDQGKEVEQRKLEALDVEVRQAEEGTTVTGYAAKFDTVTQIGHFNEVIRSEAFTDIAGQDTVALVNHDSNFILGRTSSGTLQLEVDNVGLRYTINVGKQSYALDMLESIKRGDYGGSSFAFTVEQQNWNEAENLREITKVGRLYDVSVVTTPAYASTGKPSVRSEEQPDLVAAPAAQDPVVEIKAEEKNEATPEKSKGVTSTPYKLRSKQVKTMRNSNHLKALRSSALKQLQAIHEVAELEGRDYTEGEQANIDEINAQVKEYDKAIERAEETESNLQRMAVSNGQPKGEAVEVAKIQKRYNLQKALREAANGGVLTGVEKEMYEEAQREAGARGIALRGNVSLPSMFMEQRNVYGVDSGQSGVASAVTTVATETADLVEALRPTPVVEQLGATVMRGFTGDIKLPTLPSDAASTPVEGAAVTAVSGAMGSATLSPQRFGMVMTITKEALNQTSGNMSNVIARDFSRAIGNKIDTHAFNGIIGGATGATFNGEGTLVKASETGTNDLAATDAADVLRLWSAIKDNGVDNTNAKWCMSPSIAGRLMDTAIAGSVGPVLQGGQMYGYDAVTTANLIGYSLENKSAADFLVGGAAVTFDTTTVADFLLFGDWSQLYVATWGGLDLVLDPYSGASEGTVKIVLDTYFDAAVRHAGAIGYMPAATATIAGSDAN